MEDNNVQIRLGHRIRDLRISQSMGQGRLGDMCSMSKSSISEIEGGKRNVRLSTLIKIAECLDVPLMELFRGV